MRTPARSAAAAAVNWVRKRSRLLRLDRQAAFLGREAHREHVLEGHQALRQAAAVARGDLDPPRVAVEQRAHLAHVALGEEAPAVQQHDPRGDRLDLVQHVARDQDVHALLAELAEQLGQLGAPDRIEARQRLVGDQELGIVRDRLRQAHALAHALRVRAGRPLAALDEPDAVEGARRAHFGLARAEAREAQEEGDHLGRGHVVVERVLLRAEADAPQVVAVGEGRLAQDPDRAARGPQLARDELEEGRLAGAVGADQAGHAAFDRQRELVQADHLAVPAPELLGFEQRHLAHALQAAQPEPEDRERERREPAGDRERPAHVPAELVEVRVVQAGEPARDAHDVVPQADHQPVRVALEPGEHAADRFAGRHQAEQADQRVALALGQARDRQGTIASKPTVKSA